jgi:hypothetical protein
MFQIKFIKNKKKDQIQRKKQTKTMINQLIIQYKQQIHDTNVTTRNHLKEENHYRLIIVDLIV